MSHLSQAFRYSATALGLIIFLFLDRDFRDGIENRGLLTASLATEPEPIFPEESVLILLIHWLAAI